MQPGLHVSIVFLDCHHWLRVGGGGRQFLGPKVFTDAEHGEEDIVFDDQIDGLESHVVHFEGLLEQLFLGFLAGLDCTFVVPVSVFVAGASLAEVVPVILQAMLLDLAGVV